MDKTIVGLIGALSALAAADAARAATPVPPNANEVLTASSFGELLEPIPNALALLQAVDEAKAKAGSEAENRDVKLAQLYYYPRHHHHHHHHHHHRWGWGPPPYYYHHHHHHHHHHHYGPIFHLDR
jgi:hypothetical protein